MKYNDEWDDDMIAVEQLIREYRDYATKVANWHPTGDNHSLNEYESDN